ncbi:YcxB family protein [Fimbriiglobus ruber]|uniref:YcxB family protein n=1 Tax=Fimbriiglobus ruber TaxID=1908690 RepID=UPI003B846FFB
MLGLLAFGAGLLYAFWFPLTYKSRVEGLLRAHLQKNGSRGIVGPITLILTDDSLTEITEITRSEARWQNIQRVDVSGDYTFIYVNSSSAAILPRHGFDSGEEYEAVRDFALARSGHQF